MKQILIVTNREDRFSEFGDTLNQDSNISAVRTVSPETVLDCLADPPPALVIIDELEDGTPGLETARKILMRNAMIQQALVSSMSEAEFHDTAEGLGVMARISPEPDAAEAEMILETLKKFA